MGSVGQPKLPEIEFNENNLIVGSSSWKSTSDSVRKALESYRCFAITYKNTSSEVHETMFGLLEELFSLPQETKAKYTSDIPTFSMSSDGQPKLPEIEFNENNLIVGSSSWKSTSDSVRKALESYGCFTITYKNISSEVHETMFGLLEELFSLPQETKAKYTSNIPTFGYGNHSKLPLFEYFSIEDGEKLEAATSFTSLVWPNGHDKFSEAVQSYSKLLLELINTVTKMVTSSYGLEKHGDFLIQSSFNMLRLMRYCAPGENMNAIGLGAHRDKGLIGVLGTDEVKGLQIETPDGDWIEFEPSPSKLMVVAGEILTAWSNSKIYCPLHEVTLRGIRDRYSVAIFSLIRGILQVPEEFVDDENPLKFKPFSNMEFLEYCKEGGSTVKGGIHTYCGI